MKEINIEKIMEEIRQDIKKRGLTEEILSFQESKKNIHGLEGYDRNTLMEEIDILNISGCVNPNQPIGGSGIKRFLKRAIRKMMRFYVQPLILKQNEYNSHCTRAFNELKMYIEKCEKEKSNYEVEIAELKSRISQLENNKGAQV